MNKIISFINYKAILTEYLIIIIVVIYAFISIRVIIKLALLLYSTEYGYIISAISRDTACFVTFLYQ